MPDGETRLERMTRKEFREALAAGSFGVGIIPAGSIEQHLEHLPLGHDTASCQARPGEARQDHRSPVFRRAPRYSVYVCSDSSERMPDRYSSFVMAGSNPSRIALACRAPSASRSTTVIAMAFAAPSTATP